MNRKKIANKLLLQMLQIVMIVFVLKKKITFYDLKFNLKK